MCGPLGPRGDLWARGAVVRVFYCVVVTACRAVRPYRGRARREKGERLLLGTKPGNTGVCPSIQVLEDDVKAGQHDRRWGHRALGT